jgi:hypothetical protein
MKVLGASLDMVNKKVINLADPSAATDAVNLQYLEGVVRGFDWKLEVIAASTVEVTIATPGATLDGVTLVNPMRVLLKDQSDPELNGIYVWTGPTTPLTRALDADSAVELSGSTVTVQQGTTNADRVYRCTADDPITVGVTELPWVQVGAGGGTAYLAGNALVLTGDTFNVVPAVSGGISVAADSISVDTAVVVRKFAVSIGDSPYSATQYVKAHGLATADLTVSVRLTGTGEIVYPDVTVDATNVTLDFALAPTSNQYRLVVHG